MNYSSGEAIVSKIDPARTAWEAGIREGFRLVVVDGEPISPSLWDSKRDRGKELVFADLSGQLVTAENVDDESLGKGSVIAVLITATVFALTGLLVFGRAYRSSQVISLSIFVLLTGIALAATPGSVAGQLISQLLFSVSILWIPVLFIAFFYVLGRQGEAAVGLATPAWLNGMAVIATVLSVITVLRYTTTPELWQLDATAAFVFLGLGMFAGLAILATRYFRSSSAALREQTRVIAVGTAISVLPVLVLSVVPIAVGIDSVVPAELPLIATVIIPLSFGYAILRHELLGIRRLVHRGVAYVLISALVVTIYAAVLGAIRAWADTGVGDDSAVNLAVLIALLGIPLVPRIRELSFSVVDRLLYRDFTDHREVVRDVSLQAVATETVDELVLRVLGDLKEPLGLQFAAYVEHDGRGPVIRSVVGEADSDALISLYETGNSELASFPENGGNAVRPGTRLINAPTFEGQVALISLPGAGGRPAMACLGPKETGEPFNNDDLQMIQTISGLLSTALARLQLLEELQSKNIELIGLNTRLIEVEDQERARLSGYLHDEPLQKVAYVLSQYRERNLSEDLGSILDEAVGELRTLSATLSPAVLTDLGLTRAVEWLVSDTESRAEFQINFTIENGELEARLSDGKQLGAYRVVQESLTNCQKHSKATAVWVSLEFDEESLLVSVDDNGIGIVELLEGDGRRPDSLGLLSMRQRIESQNGFLALENRRSRGFSVRARLPFDRDGVRGGKGLRPTVN